MKSLRLGIVILVALLLASAGIWLNRTERDFTLRKQFAYRGPVVSGPDTRGRAILAREIDATGEWSVPLRYWCHLSPVVEGTGGFDFLCEVESLEALPTKEDEVELRYTQSGTLKVTSLLRPRVSDYPILASVKRLSVEGCDGLQVGDRVIVFIDGEPYEEGYVIDWHRGTNCIIGHRLTRPGDEDYDPVADRELIDLLRNEPWWELTPRRERILSRMDPDGVRQKKERDREMALYEREQWWGNVKTKFGFPR